MAALKKELEALKADKNGPEPKTQVRDLQNTIVFLTLHNFNTFL